MAKYMCIHTLGPNALNEQQVRQFAQAAQRDPTVKGIRSFVNTTEGKAMCIMESPDRESLWAFYKRMSMPVDSITRVELEGDAGNVQSLGQQPPQHQQAQPQSGIHA